MAGNKPAEATAIDEKLRYRLCRNKEKKDIISRVICCIYRPGKVEKKGAGGCRKI